MNKRISAGLLTGALALTLTACGGGTSGAASSPAGNSQTPSGGEPAASGETYTVGICQQMTHDALDAATQGFKDALNEKLPGQVTFEEQDAGGEYANCGTIMDGFVADQVDLILANATYPLQAAASATADIPILGTSVTDYATALSITDWTGTVGGNISGTSDLAPLDQQAAMLQELFPDAKNVGLLYCSGEPNSVYQVQTIQGYLEDMGYTCTQYAFTDVNDLSSVTQTACDSSDVIYIPTDNTAAANTETIANVVLPAGVPVIAGESGICSGCGVATLSISYYDIGYKTGEMAAQILTGEADISTMPIEYAPTVTKMYNAANCETLGLTMPEDYEPIA
ncbi:ABC transporter substrate-binding protein [Flavonifractor sp. An91]|uniref:ABC transporter substrate-binding protein n=1 Tax=Flavonifractor sp. An91 TaxID=1965665 RepID=UPI000B3A66EC|nr:ABC transporter substrate-binding protein [Flavonifractor sp. An91]OUN11917.1 ABC transporter substrate-binding protein [Flavonifractor sp. An91]